MSCINKRLSLSKIICILFIYAQLVLDNLGCLNLRYKKLIAHQNREELRKQKLFLTSSLYFCSTIILIVWKNINPIEIKNKKINSIFGSTYLNEEDQMKYNSVIFVKVHHFFMLIICWNIKVCLQLVVKIKLKEG